MRHVVARVPRGHTRRTRCLIRKVARLLLLRRARALQRFRKRRDRLTLAIAQLLANTREELTLGRAQLSILRIEQVGSY